MRLNFCEFLSVEHDYPSRSTNKNRDLRDRKLSNPVRHRLSCIDEVRFPTVKTQTLLEWSKIIFEPSF